MSRRKHLRLITIGMSAHLAALAAHGQVLIHVDLEADGVNNGSSWANAYTALQPALETAADCCDLGGCEIWVAAGTYRPSARSNPDDPRTAAFQLQNCVAIYGAFPRGGGDGTFDARDPASRHLKTTLTGDSADDDGPNFVNNDDNCYHIVVATNVDQTAVLDGFTITGGNANAAMLPHDAGGGMRVDDASPTIVGCTFERNHARWGGGIENYHSDTRLIGCNFIGNSANHGGGINTLQGNPSVIDCTIAANIAYDRGGGMFNRGQSSPELTDCRFLGNESGDRGGGILNLDQSNPTLVNCLFVENAAAFSGGGMANDVSSNPTLINCTFHGNVAPNGAAIHISASSPTLINCILWDNGLNEILVDGGTPIVDYSCVKGGWGGIGTGNNDENPQFAPGPTGCFYLSQTSSGQDTDSPCINAGSDTAANLGLSTLTTRSDEIFDAATVDMGYHYPVTGLPLVMGDFNRDTHVDLADVAKLQKCFTGEGPTDVSPCCRIFDFGQPDSDVDLDDYAALSVMFTGP